MTAKITGADLLVAIVALGTVASAGGHVPYPVETLRLVEQNLMAVLGEMAIEVGAADEETPDAQHMKG